ncbi:MAG: cell division protein ZapE [Pseudomonadota bacterium]
MNSRQARKAVSRLKLAYNSLIDEGKIEADPDQLRLVSRLDKLLVEIGRKRLSKKSSALGWLFNKSNSKQENPRGLYIWGDVGRGKSMLMDMFFDALPNKRKRRAHFNDFMQDAQERIHAHRKAYKAGEVKEEDPIPVVGRALAAEASVLCFDEFTVTDIADAMILGRLFKTLFEERVIIVATSNVVPQNLYANGLNRNVFLPFIDQLESNVDVFELGARTDYRLEKLNKAPVFLTPLNEETSAAMQAVWVDLTGKQRGKPEPLALKGRTFEIPEIASGVARLGFNALCKEPRSAADYLALARRVHTVFIIGVPVMERSDQNAAKRFILLIDTLYDNHIRAVISAEAEPEGLYIATSGTEAFEFKRTISRLHEMQSVEYIGQ